eukprot:scaffold134064_cov118-Phaeocystis_antarctica.AAC.1
MVGLEGGVGPGAAEPLHYLEVAFPAGEVQWCLCPVVGGVKGGTRTVQQLSDAEVAARAGVVQWCISVDVGGGDGGTRSAQPLSDVEETLRAGEY